MRKVIVIERNTSEQLNTFKLSGVPAIFTLDDLCNLIEIEKVDLYKYMYGTDYFYRDIYIKKRNSNEERCLSVPSFRVKCVQRRILEYILYTQNCPSNVTGFVPYRSVVDNAKPHTSKEYIYKFDIKDFFHSINSRRVFNLFYSFGFSRKISDALTKLCTYKERLPQGAPTSPYIANLVCKRLDKRLIAATEKYGFTYTRYADDITISGNRTVMYYKNLFIKIILEEGFKLNESKIHLIRNGQQKRVTGIVVNERVTIGRKEIRKLKQILYHIETKGLQSHLEHIGCKNNHKNYIIRLYGKINFINMVDKKIGKELLDKYNKLCRTL